MIPEKIEIVCKPERIQRICNCPLHGFPAMLVNGQGSRACSHKTFDPIVKTSIQERTGYGCIVRVQNAATSMLVPRSRNTANGGLPVYNMLHISSGILKGISERNKQAYSSMHGNNC
jgi:hypothetical protein